MGLFGDIFSIGASLLGGSSSKKTSRAAQARQIEGIRNGTMALNEGYDNASAVLAPYTTAGAGALSDLNALLGISTAATPGTTDWAAYVASQPDLAAEWNRIKANGQFASPEQYGQWHYQNMGQAEGRDLTPFTSGGTAATDGVAGQQAAIERLQGSPMLQSIYRQGEEALLQNASKLGGLRGGNIQRSLADFGADTLAKVIQQQIGNLSGIAQGGLNAAGQQAGAATGVGQGIAGLNVQQGDVNSAGLMQRGAITGNTINQVSKSIGSIADKVAAGGIKF